MSAVIVSILLIEQDSHNKAVYLKVLTGFVSELSVWSTVKEKAFLLATDREWMPQCVI